MDGATAIATILKQEGMEFIGCMPSNPLIEAAAIAGIRPIVCRQERTGVHMADGFSRVNNGRRLGVFLMQAGPGAENAFGGVAQAYADSVPILLLPAGAPRSRHDVPPTFNPTRSYETVTKWSAQINAANRVPELMRRAFAKLRSGRPCPVLLEIPTDVAGEPLDNASFAYEPPPLLRSAGEPEAIRQAAQALLAAERPLLYAGQGVLYAEATDELLQLATLLQAPVITSLAGKSAFPEHHPLAGGTGSSSSSDTVYELLERADVMCGIGCSFTQTTFGIPIPTGKTLIHMTNDADDINKDHVSRFAVVGDAKLVLTQLLDVLQQQMGAPRPANTALVEELRASKARWLEKWMPRLTSDEVPLNPYRVAWDVQQTVDLHNVIVTHESGSSREQVVPFWEARDPRSFLGWGKSTQLGYSLGLAMGAKLAAPQKQVINFMGDAAFGMVGMDIETAVRERIPILTIVLNNFTMGIYPDSRFPVANERYRTKQLSGNFAQVSQALGAYGERVTTPDAIIPAVKRALDATQGGQPAVLEFITREDGTFSNCTIPGR